MPLPEGGRLRWVNDWPKDNFQKKIAKGYLIVERDGQQVKQKAGSRPDGSLGYRYLMQGPLMLEHQAPEPMERVTYNDIIDVVAEEIREAPKIEQDIKKHQSQRQCLIKWLDKHKRGKRVRERILRLNHSIRGGEKIRGWHPHGSLKAIEFERGVMGKKEFIRKFGGAAWMSLVPKEDMLALGKRRYVRIEVVQDRVWEIDPENPRFSMSDERRAKLRQLRHQNAQIV